MVAPWPISSGSAAGTTAPSWMLAPARTTIGAKSARSTAPYQTDAPASTVTSPTSVAVGATNASGCTVGRLPSNANSGMSARRRRAELAGDVRGDVGAVRRSVRDRVLLEYECVRRRHPVALLRGQVERLPGDVQRAVGDERLERLATDGDRGVARDGRRHVKRVLAVCRLGLPRPLAAH